MLPTQDNELIEKSAEALRKRYMGYGKNHLITAWEDTPYQEYWRTLAQVVLKIAEKEGYRTDLPAIKVEEASNSGDVAYDMPPKPCGDFSG